MCTLNHPITSTLTVHTTHTHTQEADSDGNYDNKLDFEEFCSLFKDLATRPELRRLFNLYSSKKEWLTVEDLQRFLEVEQGNGGDDVIMTSLLITPRQSHCPIGHLLCANTDGGRPRSIHQPEYAMLEVNPKP